MADRSSRPGLIVAIDGPAGAGKSTVARAVARRLGYTLVDTGAIYRAVAWVALSTRVPLDDEARLAGIGRGLPIAFAFDGESHHVRVAGTLVTRALRSPRVTRAASEISGRPAVRAALLDAQRRLAGLGGAVLEGRDIGTVVCPEAEVKIFLSASVDARARRRHLERQQSGMASSLAAVTDEQEARDRKDRERAVAPLKRAADAVAIDSTHASAEEVVAQVLDLVARRLAAREAPQSSAP